MHRNASILLDRKAVLASGAIIQIKVWRLPKPTAERPHGLKYSLFYGWPGERRIAYDNEAGKGDHRHLGPKEEPYTFTTLAQLIADFERDVREEIAHERG